MKVFFWNDKNPFITVYLNEYGAATEMLWGYEEYATIVRGEPEYYPGTYKLKKLTLIYEESDDNEYYEFRDDLFFNEEGYYTGRYYSNEDRESLTYDNNGHRISYSFDGYMWDFDEGDEVIKAIDWGRNRLHAKALL